MLTDELLSHVLCVVILNSGIFIGLVIWRDLGSFITTCVFEHL